MIPRPPRTTLLSLHDALPICTVSRALNGAPGVAPETARRVLEAARALRYRPNLVAQRSEEHTSELQSRPHLVCRLLLEKKNFHTTRLFRRTVALAREFGGESI